MPAEIKRRVSYELDRAHLPGKSQGYVSVTPLDKDGRKCAAWCADHYEVFAYPMATSGPLEPIAQVLRGLPGATDVTISTVQEWSRALEVSPKARPMRPGVYVRLPVRDAEHGYMEPGEAPSPELNTKAGQ